MRHLLHGRRASLLYHLAAKGRWPSDPFFSMAHAIAPAWKVQCLAICGTSASAPTPTQLTYRPEGNQQKHASVGCWGLVFGGDIALPPELLISILDGAPFPQAAWDGSGVSKMDHNATGVNTMIDQLAEASNETSQS